MRPNDLTLLQAQPGGADFSFFLMMGAIFLFLPRDSSAAAQQKARPFLRTAAKGDDVVVGRNPRQGPAVDEEVLEVGWRVCGK